MPDSITERPHLASQLWVTASSGSQSTLDQGEPEPTPVAHIETAIGDVPPAYCPGAQPPSYWSGEAETEDDGDGSSDEDSESDSPTSRERRLPREMDAIVSARISSDRDTNMSSSQKRVSNWKKRFRRMLRLSSLKWYALFFLKCDVGLSILLLVSTLLLIIPTSLNGSNSHQAPMSPTEYLILLIPLIYTIISIFSKRAYSTTTSKSNPTHDTPVPPTHYLKLYNFFYLIRGILDFAAYIKHPDSSDPYWSPSIIRSALSVATPGVAIFFPRLFPCDFRPFFVDNSTLPGNDTTLLSWFDAIMSPGNESEGSALSGTQWDDNGGSATANPLNLGSCVSGDIIVPIHATLFGLRCLTLVFLFFYTERLTRRLIRRLERNLARPPSRRNMDDRSFVNVEMIDL
ncbi:hypothetical protein BC830DRAFT_1119485 [Chytriomyces sp. MP71]|nr:hypothetical protein BC830DRAFT_1119485 [Chytriomyces sp. MP71]